MLQEITNWFATQDYAAVSLYIAAFLLYIIGFAGAILPYPGCFVALGGSICYAIAEPNPPAWWVWLILVFLAIFGTLVDNITTAMGAKKFGGSTPALWCSLLGLFVGGIFFFPLGIILGPFLGAFIVEVLLQRKNAKASVKSGFGATLGLMAGLLAKLVVTAVMLVITLL